MKSKRQDIEIRKTDYTQEPQRPGRSQSSRPDMIPVWAERNATCDIYRSGNAPPAAADVAGVTFALVSAFAEGGSLTSTDDRYTHVGYFDVSVDIRDPHQGGTGDTIYIPDKDGAGYQVVFVEKVRNRAAGFKRVFLDRESISWPVNDDAL